MSNTVTENTKLIKLNNDPFIPNVGKEVTATVCDNIPKKEKKMCDKLLKVQVNVISNKV